MADIFQDELSSGDDFTAGESTEVFECKDNSDSFDQIESNKSDNGSEDSLDEVNPSLLQLPSAAGLKKLAESDHLYNRQIAARNILDVLSEVVGNKDDLHTVISSMCHLSQDSELAVRSELVDHIPAVASFCREHPSDLEFLIRQQLIPITVRLTIDDSQLQVRKNGQNSLLVMLEGGLIDNGLLNEWICPLVAQQAKVSEVNEEYRIEAITLMCKMAHLVGKEVTERHFLEVFSSLSTDPAFSVRKVCALSFGSFCKVVGTEATESILVPKFLSLCVDDVWAVRKACAETFIDVASVVAVKTRRDILPNLFINLLCDDSRWVRLSAYQTLGGFISTFADPKKTGLEYNREDGSWTALKEDREGSFSSASLSQSSESDFRDEQYENIEDNFNGSESTFTENNIQLHCTNYDNVDNKHGSDNELLTKFLTNAVDNSNCRVPDNNSEQIYSDLKNRTSLIEPLSRGSSVSEKSSPLESLHYETPGVNEPNCASSYNSESSNSKSQQLMKTVGKHSISTRVKKDSTSESSLTVTSKDGHLHLHLDNESLFNHFQYWRMPIPEIELDVDIEDGKATSIHVRAKARDENTDKTCASNFSLKISSSKMCEMSFENNDSKSAENEDNLNSGKQADTAHMLIQTACINMITPTIGSENLSSVQEKADVIHSSFDEADITVKRGEILEIKQSHSDICSPDSKALLHPLRQHALSVDSLSSEECRLSPYEQDVVPPELLNKYIGMVEPVLSRIVDSEITRYCAFSLPAVTYALGRQYWPCIRKVCEILAADMQWKVRKTVACCLHELALILGYEIAARDLLSIFVALLKDLDEVRIGVLHHLAQFLKQLRPRERREFLPFIEEILKTDNERNWRFRHTVAKQMIYTVELYNSSDVKEYLVPVAMWLIKDRVSEVRKTAIELIAVILLKMSQSSDTLFIENFLTELDEKFRLANKWLWRQTYAHLCQEFAVIKAVPVDTYIAKIVPNLLALTWDSVPNVRLSVARCIADTLLPLDYFPKIQKAHYQLVLQVMYLLQSDIDKDVRYYACLSAEAFGVTPQNMMSPV